GESELAAIGPGFFGRQSAGAAPGQSQDRHENCLLRTLHDLCLLSMKTRCFAKVMVEVGFNAEKAVRPPRGARLALSHRSGHADSSGSVVRKSRAETEKGNNWRALLNLEERCRIVRARRSWLAQKRSDPENNLSLLKKGTWDLSRIGCQ